jgi:hypothetical protein
VAPGPTGADSTAWMNPYSMFTGNWQQIFKLASRSGNLLMARAE